ncbi:hypothetical protein LCGC14_2335390, partial [marine sediment metagenome]
IYTCPAAPKTADIDNISLLNTVSSDVSVKLYFKASGGTSRRIYKAVLGDEGTGLMEKRLTMEAADIIEGEASIGSAVDFVISGVENS